MRSLRILPGLVVVLASRLAFAQGPKCELAILNEKTWDQFVPTGKEVDAIYGDFVLRNDKIIVVVANPVAGRNANMTVKDVGGAIIDLTTRDRQSDQLSAYYPGARRYPYRLARVSAEGSVGVDVPVSTNKDQVAIESREGKLESRVGVILGELVRLELAAPAAADQPEVRLTYTLRKGAEVVEVHSEFVNNTDKPIKVTMVDDVRADRTFQTARPGETDLAWFYDKWWGQAYGVVAQEAKLRLTGSPADPRVIEFLADGSPTIELGPGKRHELTRLVFPAGDLIAAKAVAVRVAGRGKLATQELRFVDSSDRPVPFADVEVTRDGEFYGNARPAPDGVLRLELPNGVYKLKRTLFGQTLGESGFTLSDQLRETFSSTDRCNLPRVVAEISDVAGKPIPCKVQFVGDQASGTNDPYFFEDTGEHAVRNLCYSHNGRFTQLIPPGKYEAIVSYGPEFDVERVRISAEPGKDVPLRATLRRVVNSPGWISTDFHSHSSPSGDNVSSQLGRVLNLLAEHIECAPCTEHNRLDSYVPHLKALGVEHLLGTCTGMELTGSLGTINHQNAFPLVMKPRTQDNGAPLTDTEPEVQIKRLALWDNGSEKLVQQNHPDMGEMFYDRDGDGVPDEGYKGMFAYQDVIEVHPIHDAINFTHLRYALRDVPSKDDPKTKIKVNYQYNNSIFNWMQLINQGRRLPGVVNTDAHYNFHGSGYIRNYVKCQTDDPAKIDVMDIVHASEKGHVILTNGPYLEVTLYDSDAGNAASGGERRSAIPGDDLALPGGFGSLHVRVQCPNWFDIDRVQVLLNGRPDPKLNWTRSANADAFSKDAGVVKFVRKIPIEFKSDTHVIVIATSENSEIGAVMGPEFGKHKPTAISNPIFVDADGGGFKANGDTLGYPLPVKQQREVPKQKAAAARR